jgi:hypothetical protein
MPDDAPSPGPQPFGLDLVNGWFNAPGIPITPADDLGATNPYSLLRITAYDRTTEKPLAHTDVVVPVSQEIDCKGCHATGQVAASAGFLHWWNDPDLEVQAKKNILTIHDYRSKTQLIRSTPSSAQAATTPPRSTCQPPGPTRSRRSTGASASPCTRSTAFSRTQPARRSSRRAHRRRRLATAATRES